MEKLQFLDYLLAAALIWLAILSFYFIKVLGTWNKLTRSGKDINLAKNLENIIADQRELKKNLEYQSEQIEKLQRESKSYFQKLAVVRFNPFEDTGGDQSFIVAELDATNSGFVMSSLHSRSGTRIYAKQIQGGKSVGHEFSSEEKEAVEKASGVKGLGEKNK